MLPQILEEAACHSVGVDLFFPDEEQPDHELITLAKSFCTSCPVLEQCFEHGMDNEEYGIWGGMTARERRSLRRKRSNR